jgi:cytochrome P450
MTVPAHPVAAVTHADPYPYYAELVARRPLYRDETLGLWVASSVSAVTAVMTSEWCRVRPTAEPVPRALLGSRAGDIFGRMIRMNDGGPHDEVRPTVAGVLEAVDDDRAAEASQRWARVLSAGHGPSDFAFHLPVYVVAGLLGVPPTRLREVVGWAGDFVWCFSAVSTPEQVEGGKAAASHLWDLFHAVRGHSDVDVANAIGLLFQAYEATAGLIGNTLLALAAYPDVHERIIREPPLLLPVVQEVVRHDPPIQNTRRFVARSGTVGGQPMIEGDAILVVLAAANRDPRANPEPARFDIHRRDRRAFTFGTGAHACPGERLATTIAVAGVAELLRTGVHPAGLRGRTSYRPSANARVPVFAA